MRLIVKKKGFEDEEFTVQSTNLLEALVQSGINLDAPCAGKGMCGKCKVEVEGAEEELTEKEIELNLEGQRLACQTTLKKDTVAVVTLLEDIFFSAVEGLGFSEQYVVNPSLKRVALSVLPQDDYSDLLTVRNLKKAPIEALNLLSEVDRKKLDAEAIVWQDELLKVFLPEEEKPEKLLAAALDLGTTGLSATIINVETNEVVGHATSLNPQTANGADVISRITYIDNDAKRLKHLQKLATEGFKDLIKKALKGENPKNIGAAVVSGNSIMQHIFAGVNPHGLALAPYRPVYRESLDLSFLAKDLNLPTWAKVIIAPAISAYVGGDVSSGVLAIGFAKRTGTSLYIDVGTNGELVLNNNGKLFATSCAAGPTLEGMNIICGQRAIEGAIDTFTMTSKDDFEFTTIGNKKATGICGSGLIDICAALVENGVVKNSGQMMVERKDKNSSIRFQITENVFLDQKDVRQVQLAKAAIAAAIEMLLLRVNLTQDDIDEIIIAGSFGYHLQPESLKSISMIPKDFKNKITFVGNSALSGSARLILDNQALNYITGIIDDIQVIELAFDSAFQDKFLMHLNF